MSYKPVVKEFSGVRILCVDTFTRFVILRIMIAGSLTVRLMCTAVSFPLA